MSVIDKSAKLTDVAKAAGVSQGTVSNVFNRPGLVRPEVRERVLKAADRLGYSGPDPKGRLLRAGKVNAIGVATVEPLNYFFKDPYARELMRGISEACDAQGAGIALVSAANEVSLAWNIRSALVDGFVLMCIEGGPRLVELTRERGLPFVALGLSNDDETVTAIGVDDFAGARLAAEHLLALGHRRFGILAIDFMGGKTGPLKAAALAGLPASTSRERGRGDLSALAEHGVPAKDAPIHETQNNPGPVAEALAALFAARTPPTAILAMSDKIAMAALEWLTAHGKRVPEDVSVVGFDGVPEAAETEPPLTTVAQPIAELGRRAVEAILEPRPAVKRERLQAELVVRKSTARPPA